MKVFISYAREDLEIAKKLRNDLEKAGIKTWLDKEDLLPGQPWKTVILREIRESSHFIALLSSKALSKEGFVRKELKTALEYLDYLPSGRAFVIPARIDDCEPADEKLQDIHWADLFPSYEDGLSKILRVLAPNRAETPIQSQNVSEKPADPAPIISNPKTEEKPALQPETPKPQIQKPEYQLRKEPITVSGDDALKIFKLKKNKSGFRIPIEYINNDFKDNRDGTITDHATGLMWQKSGSADSMSYDNALSYIKGLNGKKFFSMSRKFAGYDDWRLPTVDELKSLLTQEKQSNDLYINPIFDENQWWCWTSDKRASGGAWYVIFSYGHVDWSYSNYYVRAVRSRQ